MRSLRRIADSGIAVVATIHQPSVAIFNSFDSLLLLKRGGETVFFGELGDESCNLIEYMESYPSTTPIKGMSVCIDLFVVRFSWSVCS